MGKVIHGEYDLSISDWYKRHERLLFVDFSYITMTKRQVSFINLGTEPYDYFFIIKPFTESSWVFMIAINFIVALFMYGLHGKKHTNTIQIIEALTLMSFVVAHALFSGALTMVTSFIKVIQFSDFLSNISNASSSFPQKRRIPFQQ